MDITKFIEDDIYDPEYSDHVLEYDTYAYYVCAGVYMFSGSSYIDEEILNK